MKFEEKMRWVKRFMALMMVASGSLTVVSLIQWNFALFIASISLGVGAGAYQIMVGFIDALLKEAS